MSPETPTVGLVAALELEGRWLDRTVSPELVEVCGPGRERARSAANLLLRRGAGALVSWGVAGGLDPALGAGAVVLVTGVLSADQPMMSADEEWLDRLRGRVAGDAAPACGPVFHTDRVVSSVAHKGRIRRRWGASIVDMETMGLAQAAVEAGVPWIGVRAVSDPAGERLPPEIIALTSEHGRIRPGAVAALAVRPRLWPDLIRLARAATVAARAMRSMSRAAGADFARPVGAAS